MTTQVKYIPMRGGMDLVSSPLGIDDGRMIEGTNFEQIFGKNGYRRVDGYERYDGRVTPSDTLYYTLQIKNVTGAIAANDVITGPSGTAEVALSYPTFLVVFNVTGTFADGDDLQVSAVTQAQAAGGAELGTLAEPDYLTYLQTAQDRQRDNIQKPPGSGPIIGVHVFKGICYCVRNADDGLSATLYKATGAGWSAVRTGLIPGGRWRFTTANFAGTSATLAMYGCDGKNPPFKYDGTTYTVIGPIYASQATSTTSLAIGTGSKSFVLAESDRDYVAGELVTAWDKSNAANFMAGTVTSYTPGTNTLVIDVTLVGGTGTVADWMIGMSDFSDKPYELAAHRSHMFFCYPQGQLQHSNLGDPLTYTSTAGSFGMGDDLTGLVTLKGGLLAIFSRSRIDILYGSSATNWQLQTHSMDSGAIFGTPVEVAGAALMVDDRGLVSLQSTQTYGDFESANISKPIKPLIDQKLLKIVGCKSHKGKNLCRIYFDDGTGVNATMFEPSALIDPKYVAFTRFKYDHVPTCIARGENADGTEVHYFGTYDGWVMREDSGWSFDGNPITAAFRIPFINLKSPANKKRFRKLTIEADVGRSTTINFRQLMDYGDGNYAAGRVNSGDFVTGGGVFDSSEWNTILWSAPMVGQSETNIDGVGRNMSVLIWHEDDFMPPFTVQGILLHYSILGLAR